MYVCSAECALHYQTQQAVNPLLSEAAWLSFLLQITSALPAGTCHPTKLQPTRLYCLRTPRVWHVSWFVTNESHIFTRGIFVHVTYIAHFCIISNLSVLCTIHWHLPTMNCMRDDGHFPTPKCVCIVLQSYEVTANVDSNNLLEAGIIQPYIFWCGIATYFGANWSVSYVASVWNWQVCHIR
jgi:hypothetical protein